MSGEMEYRSVIVSCLLMGIVIGVLGSIPILRWPNICCLWVILGGFVAAYYNGRGLKVLEPVEAAIIGAIYGVVYGITVNLATFVINIPLNLFGLGVAVRGVDGGGLLNLLGIKLGLGMVSGFVIVVLNVLEGIIFGAFGGILYAMSVGSDEDDKGLLESSRQKGRKSTLSQR